MKFLRVGIMIVEFVVAIAPKIEAPAGSADALAIDFGVASEEGEGGVFDTSGWVFQDGTQTDSGGGVRHLQSTQIDDRGIEIDKFDE